MILKPGDRIRLIHNDGTYDEAEEGDEGVVLSEPHWSRPETHVAISVPYIPYNLGAKKVGDTRWEVIGRKNEKLEKIRDKIIGGSQC